MAKILKKALAVTASAAIAASVITVPVIANAMNYSGLSSVGDIAKLLEIGAVLSDSDHDKFL